LAAAELRTADAASAGASRDRARQPATEPLYEPLGWALLRAPLLPVEVHAGSRSAAEPRLTSLFADDPVVARALCVGSEELSRSLDGEAAVRDPIRQRAKLRRYLIRMSTRPTPYGLFAGVGLARWDSRTDLELGPAPRLRARPDMGWLLELVMALEDRADVRRELRLIANPAARVQAGRVLLAERAPASQRPSKTVVAGSTSISVRATAAVREALSRARRAVAYRELAEALLATPGATPAKVDDLLAALCRQTILMTDLRPPLTVPNPARYVHERLLAVPAARDVAGQLGELLDALAAWQELPPAAGAAAHRDLVKQISAISSLPDRATASEGTPALTARPASAPPALLQVDMALDLRRAHLSNAIAAEIARAADLLMRLTPWPDGPPHLHGYRHAFESRYGADCMVPLYALLDPTTGLGVPGHGGAGAPGAGIELQKRTVRQQTLRGLAIGAIRDRRVAVELDDGVLRRLQLWSPHGDALPSSLDISAFIAASSREALDAGAFQIVIGPNLGASSAGRNLGRFADLLGDDARAALAEASQLEAERTPGRLWAEVVYLPHRLRSANVAVRPRTRGFEIAFGTTPGADPDHAIPADELAIMVRDGRLRVMWPRRGAEVVVCAGHMLNSAAAPAAVRLLEDVGRDGRAQLSGFDWGPAGGLPFLPRVSSGRIVLAPARWTIDANARDAELDPKPPLDRFRDQLERWRHRWQVPDAVYLTAGDNRLLIELDDAAHAEELRTELRRLEGGAHLLLQEAIPGVADAFLPGPGGRFMVEVVAPLVRRSTQTGAAPGDGARAERATSVAVRDRLRVPGSEWLFVKLYGAPELFDDLIAGPVRDLVQFAEVTGMADQAFFLRYADPDSHLRLRFGSRDRQGLLRRLLPEVCRWAGEQMAAGLCQRFAFDSYEREIDRYGGPEGMAVAEAIFAADSRAVSAMLERAIATPGLDRTTLAVVSIDRLLAALGASEADRLAWYGTQVASRKDSSAEYRRLGAELRRLVGDPDQLAHVPGGSELARILDGRDAALAPLGQQLAGLAERAVLGRDVETLWRSYLHLHCNRLLAAPPPLEQLLFGLLLRVRESFRRAPPGRSGSAPPADGDPSPS